VTGPQFSDAAKRCADMIAVHILAGKAGRWAAIRLSDGSSDGIAYDRKSDAIRHQLHESQCAYVKIPHGGMPLAEAESFLNFNREAYDAGFRLIDPDDPRELIQPNIPPF
jgi:hypothetical protein